MIGRQEQLDGILSHVTRFFNGKSKENVLFVTGEAGIGKSTLLTAARTRMPQVVDAISAVSPEAGAWKDRPLVSASAECSTPLFGADIGESEALKPWVDLIEQLIAGDAHQNGVDSKKKKGRFDLSKFFIDTAPSWITMIPILGPSVGAAVEILGCGYDQVYLNKKIQSEHKPATVGNQEQMFQQYINFLRKLTERMRLVLVLDDFHWADTSSTNLLFAAARQLAEQPVLFVVAFRLDDAHSSREGEGHPIIHIRNELGRYSMFRELTVPKFTREELTELLHTHNPNYIGNPEFERWLIDVSGGNALFITQFLRSLEDDGIITRESGLVDARYESVRVPKSAYSVVQERIRRLNDDAREALQYAAVEGSTFSSHILASLLEMPTLKLLRRLRDIGEKNSDVESLGMQRVYARLTTQYQFTHRLLQKALYDMLEEEETIILHERIIELLDAELAVAEQEGVGVEGIAVRIASHAATIGRHHTAAQTLYKAALASWRHFAEKETLALVRSIIAHEAQQRDPHRSSPVRDRPAPEDVLALLSDAELLRGKVHKLKARYSEALEAFQHAREHAEEAGSTQRRIEAMVRIAFTLENMGHYAEAEQMSRHALHEAEASHDLKAQGAMLNNIGLICLRAGRVEEGLDYEYRSLAVREQCGDLRGQAVTLGSIGLLTHASGNPGEALAYHERSLQLRTEAGDRYQQAFSLTNIGRVLQDMGDLEQAEIHHRKSLDIRRDIGDRAGEGEALHNLGQLLVAMERYEEAMEHFESSLALRSEPAHPQAMAVTLFAMGRLHQMMNARERAITTMTHALHLAEECEMPTLAEGIRSALASTTESPSHQHPTSI